MEAFSVINLTLNKGGGAFLGENLTHYMGALLGTKLTLNMGGAFLGENLTHNMGAFRGETSLHTIPWGPFWAKIFTLNMRAFSDEKLMRNMGPF